jgi:hypothetical protein
MMKPILLVLALAACGGKQTPATPPAGGSDEPKGVVRDTRTPLERRRDAACDQLGPKLTACAVEDAKAELAAGKVSKKQFDEDTAPAVQAKNTEEFGKKCRVQMSSRQVRVLEICFKEETDCAPLADCLTHLGDGAPKP